MAGGKQAPSSIMVLVDQNETDYIIPQPGSMGTALNFNI